MKSRVWDPHLFSLCSWRYVPGLTARRNSRMIRDWALKVYLDDKRSEKGKSTRPRVETGAGSEGLPQENNREPFLYKRK